MKKILEFLLFLTLSFGVGCGFGESGKHMVVVMEDSGAFARYEFPKRKELEKFMEKSLLYDKFDQFGKPDTNVQRSYQQAERYGAYIKYIYVKHADKFDFQMVKGRIIMMTSTIKRKGHPPDVVTKIFPEVPGHESQMAGQPVVEVNEDSTKIQSSSTQIETQTSDILRGKVPQNWKSDQF